MTLSKYKHRLYQFKLNNAITFIKKIKTYFEYLLRVWIILFTYHLIQTTFDKLLFDETYVEVKA